LVSSWVGETIVELEAGIFNGTLAELIGRPDVIEVIGPQLVERYQTIAREKLKHHQVFRRNWMQRFIAVFQDLLKPARKYYPARAAISPKQKRAWSVNDGKPPSIVASHYQGEVTLRPDQVLSARRWGNWFFFADENLERYYMEFLVDRARQELASNIKNLWCIEATYLSGFSHLGAEAAWNPECRGGLFEHLMLDVLNETAVIARHAPLAEDILEQTDLRVLFPSVPQKPASRVQVAMTCNPELHERKVNALVVPGEFIILTPLELAMCAVQPPTTPSFKMLSRQDFWIPLGGRCDDELRLAHQLHQLFEETFGLITTHPFGPMWILPPSLRQFIRAFTEYRANEASNCVREHLEKTGRKWGEVRKFTGPYWKAKFSEAPAKGEIGRTDVTALIKPKNQEQAKDVKKAAVAKPASHQPDEIKKVAPPPVCVPVLFSGWKINVTYYKNGKQHLKNLGRTLEEHGNPEDWAIPGPIHNWLKERLVEAGISFRSIGCISAERKNTWENADQLLEHLPLTKEEIESCN